MCGTFLLVNTFLSNIWTIPCLFCFVHSYLHSYALKKNAPASVFIIPVHHHQTYSIITPSVLLLFNWGISHFNGHGGGWPEEQLDSFYMILYCFHMILYGSHVIVLVVYVILY